MGQVRAQTFIYTDSRIRIHGSEDRDPYQNVTDPQPWFWMPSQSGCPPHFYYFFTWYCSTSFQDKKDLFLVKLAGVFDQTDKFSLCSLLLRAC
jgi:hypothetical protein